MKGRWKIAPTFPFYEVSSAGQLRSIRRIDPRGAKIGGRILAIDSAGSVRVMKNGRYIRTNIARLVLSAFRRLPKKDEKALHWDDDTTNNALENLRWGTHADNMQDAIRNGGRGKGTYSAIVTGQKVSRAWKEGRYSHVDWKDRTGARRELRP